MKNKLENLKDLFIEQGRELYDASKQEQNELPIIRNRIKSEALKKVIDRQLTSAKKQNLRIQEALKKVNTTPEGVKSESFQSVLKQAKNLIERTEDNGVRDAAIVNSIQRLNHNKITGLGSLASYAKEIGHQDIAKSLHEVLDEEKALDKELSDLAQKEINRKALSAAAL